MKKFLWQIAGGDFTLLEKSGNESKRSYTIIGLIFFLCSIITYFAFFGLFLGVFELYVVAVFGAALLTFIVSNIYRLNLLTLEPNSLPIISKNNSVISADIFRFTIILVFAVFVSKCIETSVLGLSIKQELDLHGEKNMSHYTVETGKMFIQQMIELNKRFPEIWFFTIFLVLFFLSPIYLKTRLNKKNEYFSLKSKRDTQLVKDEYQKFKKELLAIYRNTYKYYSAIHPNFQKEFSKHEEKYKDPPFNTIKKSNVQKFHSDDFINLKAWE